MTKSQKKLAKSEAGKIIVEGINEFLDQSKSPVSGGSFKTKLKDGGRSILFEEGDLRDAIVSKNRKGDEIEVGVFKSAETPKAYNHNKGDTLPKRQFIPGEDENFKGKITKRVDQRLDEIRGDQSTKLKPLRTTTIGALFDSFTNTEVTAETSGASTLLSIQQILGILDGES